MINQCVSGPQIIQSLSGVQVNQNATILSVTATDVNSNNATLRTTLLATGGGSEELTQELSARIDTVAEGVGLTVIGPSIRFGETSIIVCQSTC